MTRRTVEAAAKAAQFSKDISSLLERKEKDKSSGPRECKETCSKMCGGRFRPRRRLKQPNRAKTKVWPFTLFQP
jgi:hypothetical protein